MPILAIETATEVCSVAVTDSDTVLAETTVYAPRKHSELLAPIVTQITGNLNIAMEELDGVAVSIGPGSFTGLRIGLSFSKGMIFNTNCSLFKVPTLLASAVGFSHLEEKIIVIHHSHRDYYFWAMYENRNGMNTIVPPEREKFEIIQSKLSQDIPVVCRVPVNDSNISQLPNDILSYDAVRASYVAAAAYTNPEKFLVDDPLILEPDYLKDYQAVKYQNPLEK